MPRLLSKSRLIAWRQCPRRLWLEVHHPELAVMSEATRAVFQRGHQVGDVARRLYDPQDRSTTLDPQRDGYEPALAHTRELLAGSAPIFEAGFAAVGAMSFADVLLPAARAGSWRMVEVKSSTQVKNVHRDDAAIQAHVARAAGLSLAGVAVAHIDSAWVYAREGEYRGLLVEADLSAEAAARSAEVAGWIAVAQADAARASEPQRRTGKHCAEPYECGFIAHCRAQEPQAVHPVRWIPYLPKRLSEAADAGRLADMSELDGSGLNERLRRVLDCTLSGRIHHDREGARRALAPHPLPAYFLDFETINPAVPMWLGTRPYQQIPFQFSVQQQGADGNLRELAFLDTSGGDPREPLAHALIAACGERGPVFAYNAGFERMCIRGLAEQRPQLARPLAALEARLVDLLPVAREHYYHPSQQGSWSIKAVLPALVPELSYAQLEGVQHGGMAQAAYLEAIDPATGATRRQQIDTQLRAYCALDTLAMVKVREALLA